MCPAAQPDDLGISEGVADAEEGPAVKAEDGWLSHRTLVLRRGLALAAMLFILATGIITNLLITNLVT